ncbi:hypothetical protein [Paenibacillus lemnae]|uniref:Uncharacterized protein n=1 Tax=Paenibacillus lemnae TaxID=1330551 RepID=A0A848M4K7_PAELE|nr:hypothetical protein [Paenibacillus lemnae]NMO94733.1 hypothetical protein [Paenibacillus lemnae]
MKHWVGRHVAVLRRDSAGTVTEGTLKAWDTAQEKIVLSPGDITIPFHLVAKVEQLDHTPALNGIGYRVKHSMQFDNAVYFRSSVMVWKEDTLAAYQGVMTAHDQDTVTLSTGQCLRKDEHQFVVRSLRGRA